MIVADNRAALAVARATLTGRTAVVMTMGALHQGHVALIEAARKQAEHVLVTIFVNPLQFGPNEDFGSYPRTLAEDLAVCARENVDVVFTPDRAEIYPDGEPQVTVNPGPLGEIYEGASRPGFFHGVLTVVLKLLHLTKPDVALFGEKDYQQLTLIKRMARDLDQDTEIVGVPIVRESDGLALSSRNVYLSADERRTALTLSRALRAGAGARTSQTALANAYAVLDGEPGVALDYLALTDSALGPTPDSGPARLLIAARVGATRLIDNTALELG